MTSNLSRRDILRASLGAGGVFLLELSLPGCGSGALPKAVQPNARPTDFVPNAWLRITPENQVIFTLDRVEMGQGTMTSHAQLIGEELEFNPSRMMVEFAGAHRAYDNPDPQLGWQITGGSTSVKTSYIPLRQAGATAREMLRSAAAKRWKVPVAECRAEDGTIVHPGSNRKAKYGELAVDAAHERIPTVTLKPRAQHHWIGKSVPRVDARTKVDGTAIYGIDVNVPGMVTAVLLRPIRLGARATQINDSKARAVPGVVDVVHVPQGVAVVAHRYWQARRAADVLEVTWEGGETWIDSSTLRSNYLKRLNKSAKAVRNDGNVSRAEKEAQATVEAIYEAPYLAHAPLEPQNATAIVSKDRTEVWAPTQSPGLAREAVRRITGHSYDSIIIHQTFVGGGFGRRLAQDYVEEAVQVALRVKRPVKVVWSREDDMRHSMYRPLTMHRLRGSLNAQGQILTWSHRIVGQSMVSQLGKEWVAAMFPNGVPLAMKLLSARAGAAMYGGNGMVDPSSIEGAATITYTIPNIRVEYAPVSHPVPVGSWRSVGNSQNTYVVEAFLDELAYKAKRDPYQLRRSLLSKSPRELRVLDLVAEKASWGKSLPKGRFRGIAQAKSFDTACAQVAEVSVVGGEVKVHRVVVAIDCGVVVNPNLVRAQIESSIVFGLGAALRQEITWKQGAVEQGNFDTFEPLRMFETPEIEVHIVPSEEAPTGAGEPGVPPIGPAVANAILQATGHPMRTLPFTRSLMKGGHP
jgi:isoquinoline 1-oxidoreductase subunit beta